ncbi:MAG: FKBP-type peptidyl-prolyl cis-trans isomerase [Chloroflexota bacterium]|nr:FKBP-type peptidyl-prolyl cis-trans isomerase [Chloroflexota bacterium]
MDQEGETAVPELPTLGPNAATTDSGLTFEDVVVGEGEEAQPDQLVTVHYTGWLENGTQFDSSVQRGQPFQFALGRGMVIEGWDEGVQGMRVGGKRVLAIPPELAYGEQGTGGVIPPDATLIFEVELLDTEPLPEVPEAPAEVEEYITTDSDLQYAILQPGEGAVAEPGDFVSVHYAGWLEDGTMFDTSYLRAQPLQFQLGAGRVIPGWDEGVTGMRVGEKRQLRIPGELAYGEQGIPGSIPPNATLIFDVELVDVQQ